MNPASALVTHSSDQLVSYQLKGMNQSQRGKVVKNRKGSKRTIEIVEKLKILVKVTYLLALLFYFYHSFCFLKKLHLDSKNPKKI